MERWQVQLVCGKAYGCGYALGQQRCTLEVRLIPGVHAVSSMLSSILRGLLYATYHRSTISPLFLLLVPIG